MRRRRFDLNGNLVEYGEPEYFQIRRVYDYGAPFNEYIYCYDVGDWQYRKAIDSFAVNEMDAERRQDWLEWCRHDVRHNMPMPHEIYQQGYDKGFDHGFTIGRIIGKQEGVREITVKQFLKMEDN